jgi:hypothetical protein
MENNCKLENHYWQTKSNLFVSDSERNEVSEESHCFSRSVVLGNDKI